uniref:Uncharacterized protein n=1 Tax=uncultured marine virus TaxID=186617 RepID=A0A0F7L9R6_9VIRU|nr:hypothetical protein [uncultured marine virus]
MCIYLNLMILIKIIRGFIRAQHPSKQRMENMVNKVAQYKMPNVKAAQKRNFKH